MSDFNFQPYPTVSKAASKNINGLICVKQLAEATGVSQDRIRTIIKIRKYKFPAVWSVIKNTSYFNRYQVNAWLLKNDIHTLALKEPKEPERTESTLDNKLAFYFLSRKTAA